MLRVYASRTNIRKIDDEHKLFIHVCCTQGYHPFFLNKSLLNRIKFWGGTESHCDFGKILLGTLDGKITSHHRCLIPGRRRQFVLIKLVALGRNCVILLLVPRYHVAAVWFVCYGIGISARNLLGGELVASPIDFSLIFLRTSRSGSFHNVSVVTVQWSEMVVALEGDN